MTDTLKLFVDSEVFLNIPKKYCLTLELLVNKSKHSRDWVLLGDKLYYFTHPRNDNDSHNTYQITKPQYDFIKNCLNTL